MNFCFLFSIGTEETGEIATEGEVTIEIGTGTEIAIIGTEIPDGVAKVQKMTEIEIG